MSEPWFDPRYYAWLPGTLLGVLGGVWGGIGGMCAPRGKAKGLVMGFAWALLAGSIAFLAMGIIAWVSGQPYGIWYGFGLAGVIGVIVIGANMPVMFMAYRKAEERKMGARDLG